MSHSSGSIRLYGTRARGLGAVVPWFVLSAAIAVAILAPLALGDLDYNRTRLTIWASLLLATPAIALFVAWVGRRELGPAWRDWWTASALLFALHLVWSFGFMFGADLGAVFSVQGVLVATSNFVLAALWGASVIAAWLGLGSLLLHGVATALLVVSGIGSTLVFGHGFSAPVGVAVVLAVLGGLLARWWPRRL
jgi:hypothetical protein